jgi:CrcB protein
MLDFLAVATGGALGSAARYAVAVATARALGAAFPFGTLIVNIVGSMLLAFIATLSFETEVMSPRTRLALGPGFMGGFTTYSAFNYETVALFLQGAHALAVVNVVATLVACLAGGILGLLAGRFASGG